jgi:hypothetical protein
MGQLLLTEAEQTALRSVDCNHTRILYLLGLRAQANTITGASAPLNYAVLRDTISTSEKTFRQARQIHKLLATLVDADLVSLLENQSLQHNLQGQQILLPLLIVDGEDYGDLHAKRGAMQLGWKPDEALFNEIAQLVGLVDRSYTHEQVGEFVAYWMGRPDKQFSAFQWTQKFVLQRKQYAQRASVLPVKQMGYQSTTVPAGVTVDDKTKAFINKYQKKSQ